jgi:hypothetical protein
MDIQIIFGILGGLVIRFVHGKLSLTMEGGGRWLANILKNSFLPKFVLSCLPRDNLATKEEPCGVKLGERDPQN